jgi:hypothetical protein
MSFLTVFMHQLGKELLEQAVGLLEEVIRLRGKPFQHFVVCGGSSLLALELVSRTTTKDVDILARLEGGEFVQAKPLPDWVNEAAEEVREELDLPEHWFNTGPADESFFRSGFPQGIETRLTTQSYGRALSISYISRYDQIFFKLYAAADQGGKHFLDLKELNPTSDELLEAARWTRVHDSSEGFLFILGETLNLLGHADLIEQL